MATFTRSDWQQGYKSQTREYSYWIEGIEGIIPFEGTLFRNGPGLLDRNGQRYGHPFDGDGMVCRFSFVGGRGHFCNKFVRTPEFLAEEKEGKILYRGVFGTQKPGGWWNNLFDRKLKNIANTNIIYQGDKLLALWEGGQPYRLDPVNLDTIGIENFDRALAPGQVFTAHPRRDPDNGDLWGFGVEPGLKSIIRLFTVNQEGVYQERYQTKVPGFCFLHDFAYTTNYQVFAQNPISFDPLPFLLGFKTAGMCLELKPNTPSVILVFDRSGKLETYNTDPCFIFHHSNVYEEGKELVLDSICYGTYPKLEPNVDFLDVNFDRVVPGQLWRFRIDRSTGTVKREILLDRSCEFPSINPHYIGKNYRYIYLGCTSEAQGNAPLQAIMKLDLVTGVQQIHSFAPRGFVSEPIFIPGGAGEDDGWVTTLVFNAEYNRSELVILDAHDVSAKPVAVLPLSHHIPYGLHGSFTTKVWV